MQVIYEPDTSRAAQAIGERLVKELQAGGKVAWFVSGGSNVPIAVRAMDVVPEELTSRLTILLSDERYGVPGHPDSNWKQLDDAGFQPRQARVLRTLRPEMTLQDTCEAFEADVRTALQESDAIIAQFGIGGDGHIAGILPQSAASDVSGPEGPLVAGYDGGAFMRITITAPVWKSIDAAYACVYGDNKREALERLVHGDLSIEEQPAQLLKTTPEAYLYTDQQITGNKDQEEN